MKKLLFITSLLAICNLIYGQKEILFRDQNSRRLQINYVLGDFIAQNLAEVINGSPQYPSFHGPIIGETPSDWGQLDYRIRIAFPIHLFPDCEGHEGFEIEDEGLPYAIPWEDYYLRWPQGCDVDFDKLRTQITQFLSDYSNLNDKYQKLRETYVELPEKLPSLLMEHKFKSGRYFAWQQREGDKILMRNRFDQDEINYMETPTTFIQFRIHVEGYRRLLFEIYFKGYNWPPFGKRTIYLAFIPIR